jgi:hypothetical protein
VEDELQAQFARVLEDQLRTLDEESAQYLRRFVQGEIIQPAIERLRDVEASSEEVEAAATALSATLFLNNYRMNTFYRLRPGVIRAAGPPFPTESLMELLGRICPLWPFCT